MVKSIDEDILQVSCATAASKAATYMLLTKKKIKTINIDTPKGIPLTLDVQNISLNNDYVECSIKKDGGDDIDATHNYGHFMQRQKLLIEKMVKTL